jgi:hypothetical protein
MIDFGAIKRSLFQECVGQGCHRRPVLDHDPGSPCTSASEELISPGIGLVLTPGRLRSRANVRSRSVLLALERGPIEGLNGGEQIECRYGPRDVLQGDPC